MSGVDAGNGGDDAKGCNLVHPFYLRKDVRWRDEQREDFSMSKWEYRSELLRGEFRRFRYRSWGLLLVCILTGASSAVGPIVAFTPFSMQISSWLLAIGWFIALPIEIYAHLKKSKSEGWTRGRAMSHFMFLLTFIVLGSIYTFWTTYANCGRVSSVELTAEENRVKCQEIVSPFFAAAYSWGFITSLSPPVVTAYIVVMFLSDVLARPYLMWEGKYDPVEPTHQLVIHFTLSILLAAVWIRIQWMIGAVSKKQFELAVDVEARIQQARENEEIADLLLCATVPPSALTRLEQQQQLEASGAIGAIDLAPLIDYSREATVLFSDMVNFTSWSADRTPTEVIGMLNNITESLDSEAVRRSVEKVKTIGDCYWAVTGLPDPHLRHAATMVEFGLSLLKIVGRKCEDHPKWDVVEFRVGIHSGPLCGGILGKSAISYEVWGETSEIASLIEQHGHPSRLLVSVDTAEAASVDMELVEEGPDVPLEMLMGITSLKTVFIPHSRALPNEGGSTTSGSPSASQRSRSSHEHFGADPLGGLGGGIHSEVVSRTGSSSDRDSQLSSSHHETRSISMKSIRMSHQPLIDISGGVVGMSDQQIAARKRRQAFLQQRSIVQSKKELNEFSMSSGELPPPIGYFSGEDKNNSGSVSGGIGSGSSGAFVSTNDSSRTPRHRISTARARTRSSSLRQPKDFNRNFEDENRLGATAATNPSSAAAPEEQQDVPAETAESIAERYTTRKYSWGLYTLRDERAEAEFTVYSLRTMKDLRLFSRGILIGLDVFILLSFAGEQARAGTPAPTAICLALLFTALVTSTLDFTLQYRTFHRGGTSAVARALAGKNGATATELESNRSVATRNGSRVNSRNSSSKKRPLHKTKAFSLVPRVQLVLSFTTLLLFYFALNVNGEDGTARVSNSSFWIHAVAMPLFVLGNFGYVHSVVMNPLLCILVAVILILGRDSVFIFILTLFGIQAAIAYSFFIVVTERQLRAALLESKLVEYFSKVQEERLREQSTLLKSIVPHHITDSMLAWLQTDMTVPLLRNYSQMCVAFLRLQYSLDPKERFVTSGGGGDVSVKNTANEKASSTDSEGGLSQFGNIEGGNSDGEELIVMPSRPKHHWLSDAVLAFDEIINSPEVNLVVKIKTIGDVMMLAGPFTTSSSSSSSRSTSASSTSSASTFLDVSGRDNLHSESMNQDISERGDITLSPARGKRNDFQPVRNISVSSEDAARCALQIIKVAFSLFDEESIAGVHAGIHCGPLVGAIQGTSRLCFDVFGDTVNIASRVMTQTAKSEYRLSKPEHFSPSFCAVSSTVAKMIEETAPHLPEGSISSRSGQVGSGSSRPPSSSNMKVVNNNSNGASNSRRASLPSKFGNIAQMEQEKAFVCNVVENIETSEEILVEAKGKGSIGVKILSRKDIIRELPDGIASSSPQIIGGMLTVGVEDSTATSNDSETQPAVETHQQQEQQEGIGALEVSTDIRSGGTPSNTTTTVGLAAVPEQENPLLPREAQGEELQDF